MIPLSHKWLLSILLVIVFLQVGAHAQGWNTAQIDSILHQEIPLLRKKGNITGALSISQKALQNAIDLDYENGIKQAYFITSNILFAKGHHTESLEYLESLAPMLSPGKDQELYCKMQAEYGRNYHALGLFNQAIGHYTTAKNILAEKWADDTLKLKMISYVYASEASLYEEMNNLPMLLQTLKRALSSAPTPIVASRLAKYYTINGPQLDSAAYYLQLADVLYAQGSFEIYQQSIVLRNKGRYWMALQEYDSAIQAYTTSIDISRKAGKMNDLRDTYKLLYEACFAIGNVKDAQQYLHHYTLLRDSIQQAERRLIEVPFNKITLKHHENNRKQKLYFIITGILAVLAIGAIWAYTHSKAYKKRKEKEAEAAHLSKKVHESVQKLNEKEAEAQALQQKINSLFSELVHLGKENDPNFYTRFREVYPNIHAKLLKINPELQLSELTLCAYIYLDFSSKDIADCTFKSVRTIQTRKYTLRKKLGLSTLDDFHVWMKALVTA